MNAEPRQQEARYASLAKLASIGVFTSNPASASESGAATIIKSGAGHKFHVIDLPMPGNIAAAVSTPQIITRVDAFGWTRN
ncbi:MULTISPECIES: hypothetical protein [unclassified Caballeronia]|nr:MULTISPECIES: hypothetical protein [unclassified Caballeronia]MDR5798697.1 hypothetical protein [Caballeronia sp. LZ001]